MTLEKAKALFERRPSAASTRSSCRSATTARSSREALYDAPYDNENSFGATYGEHREALELGDDELRELQALADELGIAFFSTAFDEPSADLLATLGMPAYKIASGDLRTRRCCGTSRRSASR